MTWLLSVVAPVDTWPLSRRLSWASRFVDLLILGNMIFMIICGGYVIHRRPALSPAVPLAEPA
jgi:uncharacterized membrane protein YqhA